MLAELHVQNIALIKEATLEPATGLTALTGETGAGKSALLGALKLLEGSNADSGAVREGSDFLQVEGLFYLSNQDTEGCVVARKVEAAGRGSVKIDGHLATVKELAERVGTTIDICGQHEHQKLLQASYQKEMVERYNETLMEPARAMWETTWARFVAARNRLDEVKKMSAASTEALENAHFVLARIDEVNPREGELEELEEVLPKVEHAQTLIEAALGMHAAITEDGAALDVLEPALLELRNAARIDTELDKLVATVEAALLELEDASQDLRRYADEQEIDTQELTRMQARMQSLQGLMRTYGPGMAQVFSRRDEAQALIEAHDNADALVEAAQDEFDAAMAALRKAAHALYEAARTAALELSQAVSQEMKNLELGTARVEIALELLDEKAWSAAGCYRVEFMYRPAAKLSARPLKKIASGGEISRVMLACKVALGATDTAQTLVFDEVDAGVGGSAAAALARELARLAATHQVLVVTHLAQVAVYADKQVLVQKEGEDTPFTRLVPVEGEDRVREIARMLSGEVSEVSMNHARELLASATEAAGTGGAVGAAGTGGKRGL